jgi:hypothetical protein
VALSGGCGSSRGIGEHTARTKAPKDEFNKALTPFIPSFWPPSLHRTSCFRQVCEGAGSKTKGHAHLLNVVIRNNTVWLLGQPRPNKRTTSPHHFFLAARLCAQYVFIRSDTAFRAAADMRAPRRGRCEVPASLFSAAHLFLCASAIRRRPAAEILLRFLLSLAGPRLRLRFSAVPATSGNAALIAAISDESSNRRALAPCAARLRSCSDDSAVGK